MPIEIGRPSEEMSINPLLVEVLTEDGYSCRVTGYRGFEDEIVAFRNANRSGAKDRQYMDWRYTSPPGTPDPLVFWLMDPAGQAVGMASLIFRPYWMNGELTNIAVLGDISLKSELRGKGLGQALLRFLTRYVDEHSYIAFVIPNDAALKSLLHLDWELSGSLSRWVMLLDPTRALHKLFRAKSLGLAIASIYIHAIKSMLKLYRKPGYVMAWTEKIDASMNAFWLKYNKAGKALRDLGADSLQWRYVQHPYYQFKFAKLMHNNEVAGFIVFEESHNECMIYDFLVDDDNDLCCMLALFSLNHIEIKQSNTIRMVINDRHEYTGRFWKLGFIHRGKQGNFLAHWPKGENYTSTFEWELSAGDKDV